MNVGSSRSRSIRLSQVEHVRDHCYSATLPSGLTGDTLEHPFCSALDLLEDGVGLGPPHSEHNGISATGRGAYSHWHNTLYFSTSDNSDPRTNGRDYIAYISASSENIAKQTAINTLRSLPNGFSPAQAYRAVEQCLATLYPLAKIGEDDKAFWSDVEFLTAYRALSGDYYRSLERKYAAYQLVKSTLWLVGDIAECGVYNGGTAYFLARAAGGRALYLFDSFEGLSAPEAQDGSYWCRGALAISEETCRQNLASFKDVHIRRGWIPKTFDEVAQRRFCFVHIDVDLYRPTIDSVAFFYPRLVPGGMLLCDDYGFTTCPGAKQAMDEFFRAKPEQIIHLPTGQGLIIKR